MNKKGEMTSSSIATLVLTILGFSILVTFIVVYMDLRGWSEEEICAASILARATSPEEAQNLFVLKCTTKKICLTFDSDCEQFLGIDKSDIQKVRLPTNDPAKAANRIEEMNANAMYDCWKTTGEGKLSIFSEKDLTNFITNPFSKESVHPKCLICSRIALSKDLTDEQGKYADNAKKVLEKVDVNDYLENEEVPDNSGLTYLEAFTDRQMNAFPAKFEEKFGKGGKKETDQIAYVFSQVIVTPDSDWDAAVKAGGNTGLLVGGAAILTPLGTIGAPLTVLTTIISTLTAGSMAYIAQTNNIEVATSYCGSFTSTVEKARTGCSLVTPADYNNITAINDLCDGGIDGRP